MKILILSCGTGGGHNSAAIAVKEALEEQGAEAVFKEYLEITEPKLKDKVNKLYISSTSHNGKAFKRVYKLGELYQKTKLKSPVYQLNWLNRNKLYNYIVENKYDYIVATHLFPAQALTAIKKEHNIHFLQIATDYTSIPFWNETNPDCFIIPHSNLKGEFEEKGNNKKALLPIGIPVSKKFSEDYEKEKCKELLNLDKNKKYILVLTGSMGFGNILEMIKELKKNIPMCEFIVSCGKNEKVFEEIKDKCKALLFTENIDLYMKSSEIILTKPGGLTTTEVATLRKPLIHTMPIPGCENNNANFFEEKKMAIKCNNTEEVINKTKQLLNNIQMQNEMIENQKNNIDRNTSEKIAKLIIKEIKGV